VSQHELQTEEYRMAVLWGQVFYLRGNNTELVDSFAGYVANYVGRHRLTPFWGWRWSWDKPLFRINLKGGAYGG
jgi:hypothetical protein